MDKEQTTLFSEQNDLLVHFDNVLLEAKKQILIFDHDLRDLNLTEPMRLKLIENFLNSDKNNKVAIMLETDKWAIKNNQVLADMIVEYPQSILLRLNQTSERLAAASVIIVDGQHAVLRFKENSHQGKCIYNNQKQVMTYHFRFVEVWKKCTVSQMCGVI